jgi:hypothetical protein
MRGPDLFSFAHIAANVLRYAVPTLTPNSRAIFGQERPEARNRATLAASTATRGLPRRFPFALAFRNPARTRSAISDAQALPQHPGR